MGNSSKFSDYFLSENNNFYNWDGNQAIYAT
jgi:hypothetical protein